ncbi:MAG: hypothetical protein JO157_14055 [Acetobacteraceae bacterium]|nr:hypothetical protein [Acetobacteraceae bacterium]
MAKQPLSTGMSRDEMRTLLRRSKQEPVNCAIGLGDDPSVALFLLDRIKEPKAVATELEKRIPAAKSTRWGTALVDDNDPKLVKIIVSTASKPPSGIARKLVKTLKGTGFTRIEIVPRLDNGELGQAIETYAEEDDGQQAAIPEPAPVAPPPPSQDEAPKPDAAALEMRLKALIPRVAHLDAADPRRDDLARRARQAGAYLKANNLAEAEAEIESLGNALDAPVRSGDTQPNASSGDGAASDYEKSGKIWLATRKRVEDEIGKLRASILAAYQGTRFVGEIESRFADRTAPLLQTLDGTLAKTLEAAAKAKDTAERAKLVEEAKSVIARYESFAGSDPLLADLDANPFVPLAIQKTVSATLAALSKTLH